MRVRERGGLGGGVSERGEVSGQQAGGGAPAGAAGQAGAGGGNAEERRHLLVRGTVAVVGETPVADHHPGETAGGSRETLDLTSCIAMTVFFSRKIKARFLRLRCAGEEHEL